MLEAFGWTGSRQNPRTDRESDANVLQPGVLAAGDPVEVVHRPGHGVTASYLFRAVTREPDLLPGLLVVDGLVDKARRRALEAATGR